MNALIHYFQIITGKEFHISDIQVLFIFALVSPHALIAGIIMSICRIGDFFVITIPVSCELKVLSFCKLSLPITMHEHQAGSNEVSTII